jgi:hypothetical protein
MATKKKLFHVIDETDDLWRRIWPTLGAGNESGAFRQVIHNLDEAIRHRLDPEALNLYERGDLNRTEYARALYRFRQRKTAVAEHAS